jgi:hypothetical protein
MPRPSHSSLFYHPPNIELGVQIMELPIMKFSPLPRYLVPLRPKYSPQQPILKSGLLVWTENTTLYGRAGTMKTVTTPTRENQVKEDPVVFAQRATWTEQEHWWEGRSGFVITWWETSINLKYKIKITNDDLMTSKASVFSLILQNSTGCLFQ